MSRIAHLIANQLEGLPHCLLLVNGHHVLGCSEANLSQGLGGEGNKELQMPCQQLEDCALGDEVDNLSLAITIAQDRHAVEAVLAHQEHGIKQSTGFIKSNKRRCGCSHCEDMLVLEKRT